MNSNIFPKQWQLATHDLILLSVNHYGHYSCKNCNLDGLFRFEEVVGEEVVLGLGDFNLTCGELLIKDVLA